MENFIKRIFVPDEQRKRTTLASNLYYDVLDLYDNKVVGYLNGQHTMTWYYKDYTGIDLVFANMNSQFAQVVFLTGMNSKNRVVGLDFASMQNRNAMNDTNRILFCSGMFSFGKTNEFANWVGAEIRAVFEYYKSNEAAAAASQVNGPAYSAADEIMKFKNLLDQGIITPEQFEAKKNELLGL